MLAEMISEYLLRCHTASTAGKYTQAINVLDDFRAALRSSPPPSDEVSHLLEKVANCPTLPGATLVFVAAWSSLSQDYVPVLSKILSKEELASWHEQAIELLGELSHPDSVGVLTKAVTYRWEFDEWLSIPRKALHSLMAIGTDEAIAVVIQASQQSDAPEIQAEAAELLA